MLSDWTWMAWLGTAAAALTAGWSQFRGFVDRIIGYFVITAEFNVTISDGVLGVLQDTMKRSPWNGHIAFGGLHVFVRPLDKEQRVAYEHLAGENNVFWNGWWPVTVFTPSHKDGTTRNGGNLQIRYFRWTVDIDKLVTEAAARINRTGEQFSGTRTSRYDIKVFRSTFDPRHNSTGSGALGSEGRGDNGPSVIPASHDKTLRILGWKVEDLGPKPSPHKVPTDGVVLNQATLDAVNEARRWRKSEEWYKKRRIPYRRGWIIQGGPGRGKTTLIRALAQELDLPIYSFDLAGMDNNELYKYWKRMTENTPCIALFEDFDSIFNKRENLTKSTGSNMPFVTFDCLLNCIDGIEQSDGIFVIITTNKIESIDEAIGIPSASDPDTATRPGRIDRIIEMPLPEYDGLVRKGFEILDTWPKEKVVQLAEQAVLKKHTIAQFQDKCAKIALKEYWENPSTKSM